MSSPATFVQRFSLRRTLLIFSLVLVILPAAVLAVFATSYGYRSQVADARDQVSDLTDLKQREIVRWVDERRGDLDILATEGSLQQSIQRLYATAEGTSERAGAHSRAVRRLNEFLQKKTAFIELYLMHPESSVVEVSTDAAREGDSYFLSPHYREGKERFYLQPPIYDVTIRQPAMLMARPMRDPEGDVVAVLVGRVNLADLDVLLNTGVGDAYLVSRERRYLAGGETEATPSGPIRSQGIEAALRGDQGVGRYSDYQGNEVLGSHRWLPQIQAALLVEREWSEVVAAARASVLGVVGVTVLAMGLASAGALLLTRRIVSPLSDLTEAATEIATGDLERTVPVQREDEIGVLAQALNRMTARLREIIGELEQRVVERTRDLERRAAQLEAASEVARGAAAIRDVEQLLDETVALISEQFGFYHAGIFLVDDAREYAVLQAASSNGGKRMLDHGHRLRIGEMGIVGDVAASGRPRVALDVGEDAVFFDNPDLPDTRSEMAIPLSVQREVVGVLDVQSTAVAAFDDEDVAILKTMADQVALAIENARLLEESRRAVEELQIAQEERVRASWRRMGRLPAFEYDRVDVRPVDYGSIPLVDQALGSGEVVAAEAPDNGRATLAAPLRLRDQPIGVISVEDVDEGDVWSGDAIELVEEVSEQVAQALESARLFEEARTRAQQQSVLSDLGRVFSAQLDIDEILIAAHQGASQLIDAQNFYVGLYDPDKQEINVRLNATSGERDQEVTTLPLDRGLSGYIVRTGESVLIRENLPERLSELGVEMVGEPARSWLGVPVTLGGEVLGVVGAQSYSEPDAYDERDLELLTAVGNQMAIAIQSARLYEEAVETAERLREVDRLKSQFLANMSHELRTPLNSIIGFSRVVLKGIDGPVTDRQREDLEAIHNSGQHLLGLINDILDVSKIEAGKMELDFESVDLRAIIRGVMSTAIALVKDKPIELQQSVPDNLPRITADERRVRQILLNLVSNAAKFTQEGFIRVEARAAGDEIVLSVADSGPGIPRAEQKDIFEPFTQVDGSSTREHGGTGLGLTISHSFVQLHGGRMWFESEPEEGSTFYFALPIEGPPSDTESEGVAVVGRPSAPTEEPVEPEGEKLVLCVDDDTGVINLYRRYLHLRGYRVFGLADSSRALDVAKRLQPYAITLDVMMPQKDGWQVIRELKAEPETSDIPVIVCSIVSEEERGMSLGAADYLVKPIMEEDLLTALDRLNRESGSHEILVVDDNADDRALLRRMIESQGGLEVVEAAGGREAIELVKDVHPHIIILDLMMPEVDGFAVLEAVKSDAITRSIPVIAVTAKELTQEDRQRLNHRVEALVKKGILEQRELLEDVAVALQKLGHVQ